MSAGEGGAPSQADRPGEDPAADAVAAFRPCLDHRLCARLRIRAGGRPSLRGSDRARRKSWRSACGGQPLCHFRLGGMP
jgi:hypothetical protein